MKRLLPVALGLVLGLIPKVHAGNEEKGGQAGATELLINPWARSTGWAGVYTSGAHGVEAMNLNIGGLARIQKTDLMLSNTRYLSGSGISLYSIGLAQRVGDSGALGLSLTAMNWGEIEETTVQNPDGTGSTFLPQFFNIGVSYSKIFSDRISGGILVRVISESISNVSAVGVAFDAGIQYQTGERNQFKFGVALRNVGPKMRYSGNGLVFRAQPGTGQNFLAAADRRSESFEMPALLNIGLSYDFELGLNHRLTAAGNFQSNSFTSDEYQVGVEYAFMEYFMVRGGFNYQRGAFQGPGNDFNVMMGPAAGGTLQVPFGKADASGNKARRFGVDYSYQPTDFFSGNHAIALRLSL
ncbi:hypothetical protein SAMN05421823_10174 [Catalinimonas alkaloidigena]|uniref:DUF3308 domain-containing protein n=1 Tax=Catalinimonas alkaloidigena TaxID=1075417 RepID=A0A1G8WHP1_9BACT|nr:PorV/PorQ family protein [Catalinimonas alkaloidigena]SDJ77205.1 hypothetical protein SAMN05421823_10174 [Catalinimonas alkaloidigena]